MEDRIGMTFTLGAKEYKVISTKHIDNTGLGRTQAHLGEISIARE